MKIWVHTLVKNEENYLWYSVTSVIDYVDRILIWDTGSSDRTLEIIKEIQKIYPGKVGFRDFGEVDTDKFPIVRQKMLDVTNADWVMVVDGDEVWWQGTIMETIGIINRKGSEYESLVHRYYNIVGDIYHHQGEDAGKYNIDNESGHLNIRAMSTKIPGLHVAKPHGQQGYFDKDNNLIQQRTGKRLHIKQYSYMHFTNMKRSSVDERVPKREMKFKHEIGNSFPYDFYYPEVFFKPRPSVVASPWFCMSENYIKKARLQTPFKKIKRRLIKNKSGY